jgi:hypothetical protein
MTGRFERTHPLATKDWRLAKVDLPEAKRVAGSLSKATRPSDLSDVRGMAVAQSRGSR